MELKFLGRGSAFNVKEGNTSAYYKKNNILLLIDCGTTVFKSILDKYLLDDVKEVNILITHLHDDHVGSLSSLIMYCYYCKGIKVNVYFPKAERIKGYLKHTGATENIYNLLRVPNIINASMNLNIFGFKEYHCPELVSYGFNITNLENNKTIMYSGDTKGGKYTDLTINIDNIKFCDKVYHDTCLADYEGNVHTSLRKLCELIPKEFRHKIYCMHLDNNELIEKAKAEGFNVVEVE